MLYDRLSSIREKCSTLPKTLRLATREVEGDQFYVVMGYVENRNTLKNSTKPESWPGTFFVGLLVAIFSIAPWARMKYWHYPLPDTPLSHSLSRGLFCPEPLSVTPWPTPEGKLPTCSA